MIIELAEESGIWSTGKECRLKIGHVDVVISFTYEPRVIFRYGFVDCDSNFKLDKKWEFILTEKR